MEIININKTEQFEGFVLINMNMNSMNVDKRNEKYESNDHKNISYVN